MLSVAVKQSGRPESITTDVMINMMGTLIGDDTSRTQCEITTGLGRTKGTVKKIKVRLLILGTAFSHHRTTSNHVETRFFLALPDDEIRTGKPLVCR